jgi:DNA-binding LacI/PurR family transcriptional regulator
MYNVEQVHQKLWVRVKRAVPVTLKDVAKRAGVSVRTVSNVVNNYEHVTEEMRRRVQIALRELNYQPNLPARYLRNGRSGVLAFAIPDLSNVYFSDIGNAVIAAAEAHSYNVLIDHTHGERAKERLVANGLRPHLIDGVILSPLALEPEDLDAHQPHLPVVLLGERFLDVPYDHITYDNVKAAHLATEHLLSLGRRRIAALGMQKLSLGETETARFRLRGYIEALTRAGLPVDPQLIVRDIPYYSRSHGAEGMRQLLKLDSPPDAVFCFNDHMALGAIRALYDAGRCVPDDVAVIGFDDIEDGRFMIPSLSTIAPDKTKIGELAVSFLLSRIAGTRTGPPERIEVPCRLVVRESTVKR